MSAANQVITGAPNFTGLMSTRRGLGCRYPCYSWYIPEGVTLEALLKAGKVRDAHELAAHGYVHKSLERTAKADPFKQSIGTRR